MQRRLIIVCQEEDKSWAISLQNELTVPDVMYAVKGINTQQDIKQVFSDFSVTSDIIVYLMTDSSSAWMLQRLEQNEIIIHKRGLSIIPVLCGVFRIPYNFFSTFPVVTGTGDMKSIVQKVSMVAGNYLRIDFGKIGPMNFENLVKDVLKVNKFEGITLTYSDHVDFGYDMMCTFRNDGEEVENWLVEIKYAMESRFTIRSIDQILQQDRRHYLKDHKLMLVTNGFFTSIVEAYLTATMVDKNITIYVVDGWKLRNLIAHDNNLAEEYFPYE